VLALAALLVGYNVVGLVRGCDQVGPVLGGSAAPPFALRSITGTTVELDKLRGKVVLIDFWAAWCAPCLRAMPLLARLQREQRSGLRVLSVNVDGDEQSARRHAAETGGALTMLLDSESSVARRYGVQTLPHLVLIDRQGKVAKVFVGEVRERALRAALQAALR
jgi:thiol-disulfide isomerase/thioredoxin